MLNLVRDAYIRAYLRHIETRAAQAAESLDWLDGQQTLNHTELVPPFDPGSDGEAAWRRFRKQVQSLGPRAFRFKRDGTLGNINWGGDNPEGIDERLRDLNLTSLATQALKRLVANGIAAGWAYQPENGNPKAQLLGGHIEPLYSEDDAAGEVIGLYQVRAKPVQDNVRYTIRVYEFGSEPGVGNILEWDNAQSRTDLGLPPEELTETSVPRFVTTGRDQDG